jgi:fructose-1,6-bisphosphatase/inositol monophosphatase family enzyme
VTLPVPGELEPLLACLQELHRTIRDRVVAASTRTPPDELARANDDQAGDTIYAIDRVSEEQLLEYLEPRAAELGGLVLIAEGIVGGSRVLPAGRAEADARFRLIVDPIDGTRGLMYQKRSAWILSAVAPNLGPDTTLASTVLAIQTEIPLVKQHLSDQLWAIRGRGLHAERYDRVHGATWPLQLEPTRSSTIEHGFATVVRFFPGVRDELAAIEDEIDLAVLGIPGPGKALCFEDQYACTGGQLYELLCGHDRFVADLRPLLSCVFTARGLPVGLCCHPYDICTALIAEEAGVIVTDGFGHALDPRLDCESDVSWVGYANPAIQRQIEPVLQRALRRRQLLPS